MCSPSDTHLNTRGTIDDAGPSSWTRLGKSMRAAFGGMMSAALCRRMRTIKSMETGSIQVQYQGWEKEGGQPFFAKGAP